MNDARLSLIDLDQKATGYRRFLSCWVWRSPSLTYLVDPGPDSTIDHLLRELERMGVDRVDLVLLTHIHLDHGGGVARVLERYQEARLYCHGSGAKHVVDPSRLWIGSKAVLKEVADMYGEPGPVPAERMATREEVEAAGIRVIETPGHAVHHVSFVHEGILYAGEALGTYQEVPSGKLYLRPATPPRFFLDSYLGSLDAIEALDPEPRTTAFAHYGMASGCFGYVRAAREQILRWVGAVRDLAAESEEDLEPRLYARLMEVDPLYGQGRFGELDEDLQARERHFLGNTLDGIMGYLGSGR